MFPWRDAGKEGWRGEMEGGRNRGQMEVETKAISGEVVMCYANQKLWIWWLFEVSARLLFYLFPLVIAVICFSLAKLFPYSLLIFKDLPRTQEGYGITTF